MTLSFNLVDEPWIPTVDAGGARLRSLRDAFRDAGSCNLATQDAPEFAAIVRQVLLPVAIDALGRPTSGRAWSRLLAADGFDMPTVDRYLDAHRSRFDLFDPVAPFGQVAGLMAGNGETKPPQALLLAVPTGNNVPLFGVVTDAEAVELTLDRAARALLVTQCWDTAGTKTGAVGDPRVAAGKTTGNPTGPLGSIGVVIPWSTDLYHGLALNFLPARASDAAADDPPSWRRPPVTATWEERTPTGLLDLLTWQSRRVRLVASPGHGGLVVTRVVVTAGDRMLQLPRDVEPHAMWRAVERPRAADPPWRPERHKSGRALWRGLQGLLPLAAAAGSQPSFRTTHLVQGLADLAADGLLPKVVHLDVVSAGIQYGNHKAVVEDTIGDAIPLPVVGLAQDPLVREALLGMAEAAERLRAAVDLLEADLACAAGGSRPPGGHGEQVVVRLDPLVRRALGSLAADPDEAQGLWEAWLGEARRTVLAVAEPLLRAAPPAAFLGRRARGGIRRVGASEAEHRFRRTVAEVTGQGQHIDGVDGGMGSMEDP